MKQKIELPIHTNDINIVSDCWLFNRLAIIKNSPCYEDWIASHYNLISFYEYNFGYGDFWIYPPSYHDEILLRKQLLLADCKKNTIIPLIKHHICDNFYIVMCVDDLAQKAFHEILIYGFDDTKATIFAVEWDGHTFSKKEIPYTFLSSSLSNIKKHFTTDAPTQALHLSLNYQYPITALKLNSNYNPDNCAFLTYSKLQHELNGYYIDVRKATDFSTYKPDLYRFKGLCYLEDFMHMLEQKLLNHQFNEWFRGITNASKKIMEHHIMILHSLKYLHNKWQIAFETDAYTCIEDYAKCCKTIEKWFILCVKFEMTQDYNLLKRIISEIPSIYHLERDILNRFLNESLNYNKFNRYLI